MKCQSFVVIRCHFWAKMHQIQFRLGFRSRLHWWSLQRSLRYPSCMVGRELTAKILTPAVGSSGLEVRTEYELPIFFPTIVGTIYMCLNNPDLNRADYAILASCRSRFTMQEVWHRWSVKGGDRAGVTRTATALHWSQHRIMEMSFAVCRESEWQTH